MSWNTATLGQIANEFGGTIQTGPFGSQLHQSDYQDSGTPVIMPQDIRDDRVVEDSIARIDDNMVRKLSRHILQVGDIVFPRRGDLNKRAIITDKEAGWLCGTGCIKISLPSCPLDSRYLFYYFKQPNVVRWIENKAVGATMLNLNTSILQGVEVHYPERSTQERIAEILSAYDDLIDNNNRRIMLLEESVRLLYREWFVRLRFPECDRVNVVDDVPEGWRLGKLPELCSKVIDGTHDSPKPVNDGYYLVTGKHIVNGFIDFSKCYCITHEEHLKVMQRSKPEKGDILFSNIGTLGSTVLVDQDFEFSIKNIALFKPLKPIYSCFLYIHFSNTHTLEDLSRKASGTSQKFFSLKFLRNVDILLPPDELFTLFDAQARPILEQRTLLNKMNGKLREVRDRLLPRLMNGSIAV